MISTETITEVPEVPQLKRKSYTIRAQKKYYEKVKNDPELKAKRNKKIYEARARRIAKNTEEVNKKKENDLIDNKLETIKKLLKEGKITMDELQNIQ